MERITETRARQQGQGVARLGISGRDVMKALGIPEGKEVGRWLRRARQRVLEHPEENERERLIAWIRRSARGEGRVECTRP